MLHSSFTPARMSAQKLEETLVQRESVVQRLTDKFGSGAIKGASHNVLLVGPRGIGKSHLISVVYNRLQSKRSLRDALCTAYLREDEWGITSYLDLLMRVDSALASEARSPEVTGDPAQLVGLSVSQAELAVLRRIDAQLNGKSLLIILENLDAIFRNLGEYGQQQLRALVHNRHTWSLFASAPNLFSEVTKQSSPFFGSFEIMHLASLTIDDAVMLLTRLAHAYNDKDTAAFLGTATGRARVRAVQHLAGGNHRIFVLFYEFLRQDKSEDILIPLLRTIDALTPYYQAQMQRVSPQQQKLLYFLCQHASPANVKSIAQAGLLTHQTTASQLKQLLKERHVRVNRVGREAYYELSEPLLRICVEVKSHRDEPLRLLVEFLRYWFSRAELQQKLSFTPEQDIAKDYLTAALREYDSNSGHTHLSPEIAKLCAAFHQPENLESERSSALELAELSRIAEDWSHFVLALGYLERSHEAVVILEQKIKERPKDWQLLKNLGRAYFGDGKTERAIDYFERAIELHSRSGELWYVKGDALCRLKRYQEALACYERATSCDPDMPVFQIGKARSLLYLKKSKKAKETLKPVLQHGEYVSDIYVLYGAALAEGGEIAAALKYFDKAIKAFPIDVQAWRNRAQALYALGDYAESIRAVRQLLQLHPHESAIKSIYAAALLQVRDYETACSKCKSETVSHQLFHLLLDLYDSEAGQKEIETYLSKLVKAFDNSRWHKIVSGSVIELTRHISDSRTYNPDTLRDWNRVISRVFAERQQFVLIIKLFDALVRFKTSGDNKVLLELPLEQRSLIHKDD